jgi:hypothetical protein
MAKFNIRTSHLVQPLTKLTVRTHSMTEALIPWQKTLATAPSRQSHEQKQKLSWLSELRMRYFTSLIRCDNCVLKRVACAIHTYPAHYKKNPHSYETRGFTSVNTNPPQQPTIVARILILFCHLCLQSTTKRLLTSSFTNKMFRTFLVSPIQTACN